MGRYDALTSLELNEKLPEPAGPVSKRDTPVPNSAKIKNKRPVNQRENAKAPSETAISVKRPLLRRTFDFYEDQVAYLTRVSLEKRLAGEERSINAMVREALDDYIAKEKAR